MIKINMPEDVKVILNRLMEHGYEGYAVGGCVRDAILGKEPKDWDITTNASPQEVKGIFQKTIDTGIQHGTVTVMLNKVGYEVTTYRIDGEYEDMRHPKQVTFTSNLVEDLKRRDFTINAMAYNDEVGLVDEFDGIKDLENRVIRCVGDPLQRFSEDALRIMRAIRFASRYDFDIEERTKDAMKQLATNLQGISVERIKSEMDKLLVSNHPDRLLLMNELGICEYIIPVFGEMLATEQENPNHIYNVGVHTIETIKNIDIKFKESVFQEVDELINFSLIENERQLLMLKWTMLMHDTGKPEKKTIDEKGIAHFKMHELASQDIAKEFFCKMKFDNYTSSWSLHLIRWHDYRFELTKKSVRRAINKIGDEYMEYLFLVQRADILGQNPNTWAEKCYKLAELIKLYRSIKADGECFCIKDLAVSGQDLIKSGIKPGPHMGEILNNLLEIVLEAPELNNKDILISKAMEFYRN